MTRRALRRGIALERAQRARDWQDCQDDEYDPGDALLPAHLPSIPRAGERPNHSWARRRRSALPMTDTELNVMAALASIGLSSTPNHGYRIPAATGTPATL